MPPRCEAGGVRPARTMRSSEGALYAGSVTHDDATATDPMVDEPAPTGAAVASQRPRVLTDLGHPFRWGLVTTFGVLTAWLIGQALVSLSTVLVYLGVALFLSLALDPLVGWLEAHRMSRGLSIAVVFVGFALIFTGLLALVVPTVVEQVAGFAQAVPTWIADLQNSPWFVNLMAGLGPDSPIDALLTQLRTYVSNPANLLAIGGGVLAVGSGVISGLTGVMMVLILTLYFLATLRSMKVGFARLVPAYSRPRFTDLTNQITSSVGSYVTGMFTLAICNAGFAFILLSVLGVRFALLLAVLALFITMIPMVGSVLFWALASSVSLLSSWWVGLIFAAVYFAYMQVEAYVMTPRVMSKQISIPGSMVIIGALVGGTLLGLLGALVAVPVTAAVLMVLEQVVLPKQDAKLVPPAATE